MLLFAVACGGDVEGADEAPAPEGQAQAPAAPPAKTSSGGSFLDLPLDDASALAESQGRPWRVGRVDGERLSLTQDFVVGRVTFEVDDGVVTGATVEGGQAESIGETELVRAAIERIVKVDNSFGGGAQFERVEVQGTVGGARGEALGPTERDLIAGAIDDVAEVVFIDDARRAIEGYVDLSEPVAVVSVSAVRVDGETAEVDVQLWCGSTCGVFVTYEAVLEAGAWQILGPTGPLAVS